MTSRHAHLHKHALDHACIYLPSVCLWQRLDTTVLVCVWQLASDFLPLCCDPFQSTLASICLDYVVMLHLSYLMSSL